MDGFVIFVPFTVPGDEVVAEIVEHHKSYAVAHLKQILTPSPHRREPPCPVVGRCGGCQWQQVTYTEQIRQKEQLLKDNLRNLNRFGEVQFRPFIGAKEEFRYRNRIQVHRRQEQLGFFAAGSHDLVTVDDCWLADPQIVAAFKNVRDRAKDVNAKSQERVEIALRPDGRVEIDPSPGETVMGRFAQVNNQQNEVLIEVLRNTVRGINAGRVIDLYCGSGNLTFPLAQELPDAEVHGVELSGVLIAQAKDEAAKHPAAARMSWYAQPSSVFLKSIAPLPNTLVVLDPPRPGCDKETRSAIAALRPERIIYVSCNPTTLARDAESWLSMGEYRVDFAQGIDMFPQTAHLEAVLSLIRK